MEKTLNKRYSMLSQPKGFYILALGECWERLSYYGAQTILVLYLTKFFLISDDKSYSLYGVFTTLAFAMPVIGGILADKVLGYQRAVTLGGCFLCIGNLLLSFSHFMTLCLGLTLLITGTGLYKANCTNLASTLYSADDKRREGGFTLFYMSMNIGATIGALLYGLTSQKFGWHVGFIFTAIGIALNLAFFLWQSKKFLPSSINQNSQLLEKKIGFLTIKYGIYLLILLACLGISLLFFYPYEFGNFVWFFSAFILIFILINAYKYSSIERNRLLGLLVLSFFSVCFFSASLQVSSSILLFISRNVNRIIERWEIPTILFGSLYPLAVIIIAPIVSWLWTKLSYEKNNPSLILKQIVGLGFGAAGFTCFFATAKISQIEPFSHLPLLLIVIANLFLGAGELLITPAILSAITRLSPQEMKGTMTGAWFLSVAIAGYLSSVIAKVSNHTSEMITNNHQSILTYIALFKSVVIGLICVCLFLIMIAPGIKYLLKENMH